MRRRTRFRRGLLLPAIALMVALAGCGAPSQRSDDSAAAPAGAGKEPQQAVADGGADTRAGVRSLTYTGRMTIRVDDVDGTAAQAITLVTGVGGFVGGDRRSGRATSDEAVLILRVPAERFTTVVDQLAGLGDPLSREITTEDVTEESIDLAARIETQRARVASGRKLLADAVDRGDWLALEREVAQRESDLAALEAKQRRLNDLVALSTITVTFVRTTPPAILEPEPGFTSALAGSWEVLVASGRILLLIIGALLPWLLVLGLPVVALVLWRRRRRDRRGGDGGSGPAVGPRPMPGPLPGPLPRHVPAPAGTVPAPTKPADPGATTGAAAAGAGTPPAGTGTPSARSATVPGAGTDAGDGVTDAGGGGATPR